jgi:hypothetical protein
VKWLRRIAVLYWIALSAGLLWPHGGGIKRVNELTLGDRPQVAHLLALMLLGAVVIGLDLLPRGWSLPTKLALLLGYAVAGELGQMLVPGRTTGIGDGLANVLGILAGIFVGWVAHRWIVARRPSVRPCPADSSNWK